MSPRVGDRTTINQDEEDCMFLQGYKKNRLQKIMLYILIVCTGGIFGLIFYWRRDWFVKLSSQRTSVENADIFLLENAAQEIFVSSVADLATEKRFFKSPPAGSIADNAPLIKPSVDNRGHFDEVQSVKYFDCKRVRYIWNTTSGKYEKLLGIPDVHHDYFEKNHKGLSELCRSQRLILFGLNAITIKVYSVPKILVKEALTPFYAFQLFSIILWYNESYAIYASVIVVISSSCLSMQVFETWRQQNSLCKQVHEHDTVQILMSNERSHSVHSETLVPGDIILIPRNGANLFCDAVLLSGHCIVDESSLTGGSVPVSKVPVFSTASDQYFNIRSNNRSMLFCGTQLLQSRGVDGEPAKAMVLRTGFMTAKGELIRSIIYFRRIDFKFQNQTFWYIFALSLIAAIGMVYSIIILHSQNKEIHDIVIRTLDLVTIVIPPALPAALSFGIIFSQWRLRKHKIFCISPHTINMCGSLNMVCFDKTGTLTEEGMDLKSIIPSKTSAKGVARFQEPTLEVKTDDVGDPMVRAMATCHSLALKTSGVASSNSWCRCCVGDQSKSLLGDTLDLMAFKFTKWKLLERTFPGFGATILPVVGPPLIKRRLDFMVSFAATPESNEGFVLYREFPFASKFQRMGVIVFNSLNNRFESYVKGSVEKVIPLCHTNTVPSDWINQLEEFSSKGNRVIALAWKPLEGINILNAKNVSRSDAEDDLQFIGLMIFENRIKPDTPSVIEELYQANIRNVMLTGDNMHTAMSVARKCGIIRPQDHIAVVEADEHNVHLTPVGLLKSDGISKVVDAEAAFFTEVLALTGDTLQLIRKFHPHFMPQVILQGAVFARVSPLEKQFIVEQFQDSGYQVAMCGDGANDYGALRAAHAGISLSKSEAAAAAPFTSTNQSIACVPLILREGRCALVTFFGIFFLMATYSMAQFASVVLIYSTGETLSDWEFLYQDLFQLTILAIVIPFTSPYDRLTKENTPSNLKSFPALFSLIGHVILILAAQVIAFGAVKTLACDRHTMVKNLAASFQENITAMNSSEDGMLINASSSTGCEPYATFTVGTLQIVFFSVIFATGPPFRKQFYTNYIHMILAAGMIIFDLICMLGPTDAIMASFEMSAPSALSSRFIFLSIAVGYLIVALFFDRIIVHRLIVGFLNRSQRLKSWRNLQRADVEDSLRKRVNMAKRYTSKSLKYQNAAFSPNSDDPNEG